eukprot:gene7060-11223_t
MNSKTLLVVIVVLLVTATYAVPVRCDQVTIDALEFEDDLLEFESEDTLSQLADPCKDGRVCIFFCKKKNGSYDYNRKIYFSKFVQNSAGTEEDKTNAYENACVKRTKVESEEKDMILYALKASVSRQKTKNTDTDKEKEEKEKELNKQSEQNERNAAASWKNYLNHLEASNDPAEMYFAFLGEILITFGKVCKQDPNWMENLDEKIDDFIDYGYERRGEKEKNIKLKEHMKSKRSKMKQLNREIKSSHKSALEAGKKRFIEKFKRILRYDLGHHCLCSHYFTEPGISIPPAVQEIVNQQCQKNDKKDKKDVGLNKKSNEKIKK